MSTIVFVEKALEALLADKDAKKMPELLHSCEKALGSNLSHDITAQLTVYLAIAKRHKEQSS